jgi:hypothetical protein
MTVKARKCTGCKALTHSFKKNIPNKGVCSMGRSFVTCDDSIIPLAPCCPSKSITWDIFNY